MNQCPRKQVKDSSKIRESSIILIYRKGHSGSNHNKSKKHQSKIRPYIYISDNDNEQITFIVSVCRGEKCQV